MTRHRVYTNFTQVIELGVNVKKLVKINTLLSNEIVCLTSRRAEHVGTKRLLMEFPNLDYGFCMETHFVHTFRPCNASEI